MSALSRLESVPLVYLHILGADQSPLTISHTHQNRLSDSSLSDLTAIPLVSPPPPLLDKGLSPSPTLSLHSGCYSSISLRSPPRWVSVAIVIMAMALELELELEVVCVVGRMARSRLRVWTRPGGGQSLYNTTTNVSEE